MRTGGGRDFTHSSEKRGGAKPRLIYRRDIPSGYDFPPCFGFFCLPSTVLTTSFESEEDKFVLVCVAPVDAAFALDDAAAAADWLANWLKLSDIRTKSVPFTLPS